MSDLQKQGLGIQDILEGKRETILRTAEQYGASNIRVFGSVARGEARPDSDVDLLVAFKLGYSLWERIELMLSLEALLGRKVDISTEETLHPRIKKRVLREAVPL